MASSLMAIKATTDAISSEQKRAIEKKRNVLVLVNNYLIENGYIEAAERLQHETSGSIAKYAAADNVDLLMILGEYESYYELRFDKKPKLVRKLNDNEEITKSIKNALSNGSSRKNGSREKKKDQTEVISNANGVSSTSNRFPSLQGASNDNDSTNPMSITGTGVVTSNNVEVTKTKKSNNDEINLEERILKPPPQFGGDSELKELASAISRDIYVESPDVKFDDIIGLEEAKRLLIEAVQLPIRFPTLFTGILRPWKGILLHGPPGTGKTLLAKAVASECHTTFFNISASSLVSKWRGDSEKLVRVLFEMARYHSPSTIFLDEIDSILSSRGGEGNEHEASRRMKTELLIQMDGVRVNQTRHEQVFVMAASNLPWDLDIAVLRRLEKRVLVSLPNVDARHAMFEKHLLDRVEPEMNFNEWATASDGYSGADIELVCRESAMMPVRRLMQRIEAMNMESDLMKKNQKKSQKMKGSALGLLPDPPMGNKAIRHASSAHIIKQSSSMQQTDVEALLKADPVTAIDINAAISTTKPSSDGKIARYELWQKEFGSV